MAVVFGLVSILALVGWVWIVIWAFSDSVLWGLGCIFIPFCALVYGILKFDELKTPTILYIIGMACGIAGRVV